MGACCIVFDIDGMLFEFVMSILNNIFKKENKFGVIEKNAKILKSAPSLTG